MKRLWVVGRTRPITCWNSNFDGRNRIRIKFGDTKWSFNFVPFRNSGTNCFLKKLNSNFQFHQMSTAIMWEGSSLYFLNYRSWTDNWNYWTYIQRFNIHPISQWKHKFNSYIIMWHLVMSEKWTFNFGQNIGIQLYWNIQNVRGLYCLTLLSIFHSWNQNFRTIVIYLRIIFRAKWRQCRKDRKSQH